MYTFQNFGVEFEKRTLKNGSSLFLFRKSGAPLYIRASVNAGTRWNNIPGTAHFVEHMIIAGSKKFPSKNLLVEEIEKVGGEISASTNFDTISVNAQVAEKNDLSIAIDILNEMLRNSLFDPSVIENERGAILSELRSKKSNPNRYVFDLFSSLVFQNTYMKYPTLGNEESNRQIDISAIKNFYSDYFSPERITYIACGDIEIDKLENSLENSIKFNTSIRNSLPPIPETIRERRIDVEYFENKETHFKFGFRADTLLLKEKVALFIIGDLLAVGRASILATELRYKRGLVYTVYGSTQFFSGVGSLSISTSCSEEKTQQTIDIICEELDKIYKNGVNEESLNFSKRKILKSKFIEMQTASSWVNVNDQYLNNLAVEKSNIIDLMNIVENITSQEVNQIFRKYIKPGSSYLAVCGKNSADSLNLKH